MVTMPQYHQHLYVLTQQGESVQNANGSWQAQPTQWAHVGLCREETNGKGNTVTTADGQVLVFSSLIQLPTGTPRVSEGKKVIVTRTQVEAASITDAFIAEGMQNGEVVAKGICKKFDNGRLHCRLWI